MDYLNNLTDREDPLQHDRPAFIPQPELRDTVPNIGLYSVLYKLPPEHFTSLASATSSEVGRQLNSAVEFFDRVVPNQPGYSSSVAAVTMLPDVNQVSRAWKKWFACAGKLRRLRFIRRRLRKLREGQERVVHVVFATGRTSPERAESSNGNCSSGEQSNGSGLVDESVAEPSTCKSEQSHSSTNSSDSTSFVSNSQPQQRSSPLTSSSPGVGSPTEKIRNTAVPARSSTPLGALETVKEGSSSDSSNGYSSEEDQGNEFIGASHTVRSIRRSNKRCVMNDIRALNTKSSGDSSESSRDVDDTRDVTYRLDQPKSSQYPKASSNESCASFPSLENSIGRNLASSLGNSAQRERFLSSVGIQEEAKLDHFLSEDEIEQLTVYCREFARR
jgi:hypothetical protein